MRIFQFGAAIAMVLSISTSAHSQDQDLKECRGLGLEQLLQSFVLNDDQQVFTANLIAFCDDYGALKRETIELRQGMERQAQTIDNLSTKLNNTVEVITTFRGQLGQIADELNAANKRLPPEGSILLVDNPGKCPAGWVDMARAEPTFFAGRSVIAVGASDERGPYEYRDRGGSETHKLTKAEMPSHSHGNSDHKFLLSMLGERTATNGDADATKTQPDLWPAKPMLDQGGSQPHNNMPPYIALYFCKKEG